MQAGWHVQNPEMNTWYCGVWPVTVYKMGVSVEKEEISRHPIPFEVKEILIQLICMKFPWTKMFFLTHPIRDPC